MKYGFVITCFLAVVIYVLFFFVVIKPLQGGIVTIHTKNLLHELSLDSRDRGGQFLEVEMGKKEETPWLVNLVYAVQEGSTVPTKPRIKSQFIAFQTVNYVVSNTTYMANRELFRRLEYYTNVTITNFSTDHDYLAFLLSFYYKSDAAIVVKVNSTVDSVSLAEEIGQWIDLSVSLDGIFSDNVLVAGELPSMSHVENQSSFMLVSNAALRHLLMYTDITYSYESLFSLLPRVAATSPQWKYYRLSSHGNTTALPVRSEDDLPVLNEQKCKHLRATLNSSVAVFLRTYQRNYIRQQVERLLNQTYPPQVIVILQNRNLVDLRLDEITTMYSVNGTTIFYLWNVNWNSFFHLSYLVSSLMPTDLSFTYDDDQLLSNETTHEQIIRTLVEHPMIYSLRSWCWCKKYYSQEKMIWCSRMCDQIETDLVVNPFFTFSHIAKYTWRYDIPTYYCCEEMSLLFAANIECGIPWKHLPLTYESYQMDRKDRSTDEYTIKLQQQNKWTFIEHDAMTYYTKAGYRPRFPYDPRYKNMERCINPI